MKQSRTDRAHGLAEWFRAQAETGTASEADLMARAALALERIASSRPKAQPIANDNMFVTKRRGARR